MQRLIVNNQDVTLDSGAKTWGELLTALDTTCHAQGRVVTAARLDGVDEPSFREPSVGGRALDAVAVIEVEAVTPATLLADAIRGIDGPRSALSPRPRRGTAFPRTPLAPAQQGLLELVQGLQVLTSLVATVSAVLQADTSVLMWEGKPIASISLDGIGVHLESLIEAQQREDWLTVADVIEFDIEPALRFLPAAPRRTTYVGAHH